jgi:release factor glutamine methyltransferase
MAETTNSRNGAPRPPERPDRPQSGSGVRDSMWTVAELLAWTRAKFEGVGIHSARLDAEVLLAHALGWTRVSLYARHDEIVAAPEKATFRAMVKRRLGREPVAYITGTRGFHALDLELQVDRRVLVPRPETEHLVDWLLEELRPAPAPAMHVLDVGTGSGAIALAIKRARDDVDVTASDVSSEAITVAHGNGERAGLAVTWAESDLLDGVAPPAGGWSAIAANLPYVPAADFEELPPEVRTFEPRLALDGGPDGLDVVRRLVAQCGGAGVLARGAGLYLEIGRGQADDTAAILRDARFEDVAVRKDYAGIGRVVRGFAPPR